MRRFVGAVVLLVLAALPNPGSAGDGMAPALGMEDVFDPSGAKRPRPGEWLEYRVAFPEDPLEHMLREELAAAAGGASVEEGGTLPEGGTPFVSPSDGLSRPWRSMPVRLEILEVSDDGCNAVLVYPGGREEVRLTAAGGKAGPAFRYDRGGGDSRSVRVGGVLYRVEETSRYGEGYGFVRWFSPMVPFGIVRFATGDVDIALVGMGMTPGEDFPLRQHDPITPPLGELAGGAEE